MVIPNSGEQYLYFIHYEIFSWLNAIICDNFTSNILTLYNKLVKVSEGSCMKITNSYLQVQWNPSKLTAIRTWLKWSTCMCIVK